MRKLIVLCACLALSTMGATDCGDDPEPSPTPTPTPSPPPTPTPSPTPVPGPTTTPSPRTSPAPRPPAGYSLTQAQAYQWALAGKPVGGYTQNGEVQVAKTTITVTERRPTEKCDNEYDSYTGEYEYKCKTVYELEKVPKTVYITSGPRGQSNMQFDNIAGAFAYAAKYRITAWRIVH
jgi:hypothetical protein